MVKKVIIGLLLISIMGIFSLQSIKGQGTAFLNRIFMQKLIEETKSLMENNIQVNISMDEMLASSSNKTINGQPIVFEVYLAIRSTIANFFEDGKYLSGLYIDNSGIYDIANGSFFDAKHYLPEEPRERFVVEGIHRGKFYLIMVLSNEVPYFGDFINERNNFDDRLGLRYMNNVLEKLKIYDSNVFVFELDSSNL